MEKSIVSYKGFDKGLKCRGYQFEIGGTYEHDGEVKACESGFHACEYPLDVFNYYVPADSRFAVVEQSGSIDKQSGDSKVASSRLTIKTEIGIPELVKAAIEYTIGRCNPIDRKSPASATGIRGAASTSGDQGAASASGIQGAASATGDRGAASATGDQGAASATGYRGAASATGYHSAASATGYQGAASATGDHGAASATGYHSAASATGYQGAASATGDHGAASATGEHSVAMACGFEGKAKANEGSAIVLVNRDEDGAIRHIRCVIAGKEVKADTWYKLNDSGEFEEID